MILNIDESDCQWLVRINPLEEWKCRSCCGCGQVVVLLLSRGTWEAFLNTYLPASVFPAWHPADADGPSELGRFAYWWIQTGACEIKHGRSTACCRQRCGWRDNHQGNGLPTSALSVILQHQVCSSNSVLSLKPMKAVLHWLLSCLAMSVCVSVSVHVHAALKVQAISSRIIYMPLGGDACVLHYAGWAGFVLTWRVCVCLKESSCFIRLSGGVLVPYSLASKDLVQTQAYKLSSIFILTSNIRKPLMYSSFTCLIARKLDDCSARCKWPSIWQFFPWIKNLSVQNEYSVFHCVEQEQIVVE